MTALEYYFGFKTELVEASQLRILAWNNLRKEDYTSQMEKRWQGGVQCSIMYSFVFTPLSTFNNIIIMSTLYLRYYYYVYIMSMLLLLHTAKQSKLVPKWLSFILVLLLWQHIPVLLQIKILFNLSTLLWTHLCLKISL